MLFELILAAFVISASFAVYVYIFNPTLLGSLGVSSLGVIGSYLIDMYSAFSARLQDGLNVLTGGEGSVADVLLLIGMVLMIMVFAMNAIVTALDKKPNNFTLVR